MQTIDQIYPIELTNQVLGVWKLKCRLRILQPHIDVQIVMISDMGFEMGWFIPSLVENLVDQVVQEFHLEPAKLIWIEDYTSGSQPLTGTDFSQVTFEWHNGKAMHPRWSAMTPESVQQLVSRDLQLQVA